MMKQSRESRESRETRQTRETRTVREIKEEPKESRVDFNSLLTQDFILLLGLCKDPKEVFPTDSPEYSLAQKWIDKLSQYPYRLLCEKRFRNTYMSHLVACLNNGNLCGPFKSVPPTGSLPPYRDDIETTQTTVDTMPATSKAFDKCNADASNRTASARPSTPNSIYDSPQSHKCTNNVNQIIAPSCYQKTQNQTSYSQRQDDRDMEPGTSPRSGAYGSANECCNKGCRGSGGACSTGSSTYSTARASYYAASTTNKPNTIKADNYVSNYVSEQTIQHAMTEARNMPMPNKIEQSKANAYRSSSPRLEPMQLTQDAIRTACPLRPDGEYLREDISALLNAIADELRGDVGPGSNKYLEQELTRYKGFIMNFSSMACMIQKFQSKPTMRSYLLLNLQNDLVKLLSEI